ncbi:hypothetical protein CIB48_g1338 [Xylaria polymorpha]|nr:hypothetical protein CIB48_g1338 [Xylaria polymorpha]
MDPKGSSSFGWGGRDRGPHNTRDGSRALDASQGTNTGTTGTSVQGPLIVTGSRLQIQKLLDTIPGDKEMKIAFTLNPHLDPNTPNTKRKREDESDTAPKSKKPKTDPKHPEVINPKLCGNCGAKNHKAAFCVKTGRSGWMEACPKCDSTQHLYETCPQRMRVEDFIYLVFNRQRKPPVKSKMKLSKVIRAELQLSGSKWHSSNVMELPYSSRFARQMARTNPPEAWTYRHVGNPTEEAKNRIPDPNRTGMTLYNASTEAILGQHMWSPEEEKEKVNPEKDRHMTTMRSPKDIKGYECSRFKGPDGDLPYPKRGDFRDIRKLSSVRHRSPPKDLHPRIKSERLDSPEQPELLRSIRPVGKSDDFSVNYYDDGDEEKRHQHEHRDRRILPQDGKLSTSHDHSHENHHGHSISHISPYRSETTENEVERPSNRQHDDHRDQRGKEEVYRRHKESHDEDRGRSTYREISGGSSAFRSKGPIGIPNSRRFNGMYIYKHGE